MREPLCVWYSNLFSNFQSTKSYFILMPPTRKKQNRGGDRVENKICIQDSILKSSSYLALQVKNLNSQHSISAWGEEWDENDKKMVKKFIYCK